MFLYNPSVSDLSFEIDLALSSLALCVVPEMLKVMIVSKFLL